MAIQFGLLEKSSKSCLPLRSLSVEGDIKGHVLSLSLNLLYDNTGTGPVEVVFKMPLDDSSVLVGLTAVIDGKKIKAQVKEKEEAKIIYDDAIASGLPAALGEEVTKDIFSISLGNLPPGCKAEITLSLVAQLPIDAESKLAFSLPTLLKERYTPPSAIETTPSPPQPSSTGATLEGVTGFILQVHYASTISEITSETHSISVKDNTMDDTKIVTLSDLSILSRDLVIQIALKEPHVPLAIVEKGEEKGDNTFMSNDVIMVNFIPSLIYDDILCEFIFLVDRSGSMSGSFIKSASETLILFLKSLPEGCYFNIFGFGSRYVSLYAKSVPYDQSSLEFAIDHAQKLKADLGGTEILPPLCEIYKQPLIKGLPRQIFLLTDGSVSNTGACIEKVKSNVHIAKCFTFGIGSGASTALVSGMAAAGKGSAEFVKEGERLQPKVIRSLKHAMQPSLTDVKVTFDLTSADHAHLVPWTTPTLYDGERIVVYGIVKRSNDATIEGSVTLSGTIINNKETTPISHTISFKQGEGISGQRVIHHLAAKAWLAEMENEKKPKEEIVKLSVESSVVSMETAFVAVDEETSVPINEPLTVYQASIENQLSSIRQVMAMNIDQAITRGEALDNLQLCSEDLNSSASMFKSRAKKKGGGFGFLSGVGSAISSVFSWGGGGATNSAPSLEYQQDEEKYEETKEESKVSRRRRNSFEKERDERGDTPSPEEILTPAQLPATNAIDISSIILLQQANGSWLLTETLASFLNTTVDALKDGCPTKMCPSLEVWATALVIVTLQGKYIGQKDEWELVVKKADGWLKGQTQNINELYEIAKKFI